MGASFSIASVERTRESILLALHTERHGLSTTPLSTATLSAFQQADPQGQGWIASSSLNDVLHALGLAGRWDRLLIDAFVRPFVFEEDESDESDGARTSSPVDYAALLDVVFFPLSISKAQLTIAQQAVVTAGGWSVHEGEYRGRAVVVKQVDTSDSPADTDTVVDLRRRVNALRVLRHPHLVRYIASVATHSALYVIQQAHASCSLQTILASFGPMKEATIRRYVTQALAALQYLHNHDIIHGNLHLESIHIDSSGLVKLSDFGAGEAYRALLTVPENTDWLRRFPPPEQATSRSRPTKAADVWSLGVLLLQMAYGVGDEAERIVRRPPTRSSATNVQQEPPPMPATISSDLRTIVGQCLQRRPKARPTIDYLCSCDVFHVEASSEILRDVCADLDASMHRLTTASARRVSEPSRANTRPASNRHASMQGRPIATGRHR